MRSDSAWKFSKNAVAQHGSGQRRDVLVGDVIAAAGKRARLGGEHDELRGANAAAVVHIFLDEVRRVLVLEARGAHEVHHVLGDRFGDRHHAHQLLKIENLLRVGDRLHLRDARGGGQVDHFHFVVRAQVIEHGVEQEAVELRFGQRIGAFELDRVLRGQHEERRRQLVLMAAHGAGKLLHGFEQRRLRLGRRAVDFVGQQDVAEDRAGHEGPAAMAGGGILLDDVGAGDVGRHQVRRELDALELQAERLRDGAHHQRLRGAGKTGDQAMAADEERGENLIEHLLLADDDLPHLA